MRRKVIEVDITDHLRSWDDLPIDAEDAGTICEDVSRARSALQANPPKVAEALVRLDRALVLLGRLSRWKP